MRFCTLHAWEVLEFIEKCRPIVIDLREGNDYRRFHLEGAVNFPYEKSSEWESRLPRGRKLLFYCDRGNESMREASKLAKKGYETYTLIGGIRGFRDDSH